MAAIDLGDGGEDIVRATDVCIVGAGAAGISAARRLRRAGLEVVLLESGGADHEAAVADLNDGTNVGEDYYPLVDARLRFFGGTTAIWGGRVAELDPIDLETRAWVPHSGWPIGWDELVRYYDAARPLFGLSARRPAAADLAVALPGFDPGRLATPVWSFDRRSNRFTLGSCRDLIADPGCLVALHANATELERGDGGQIARIVARSLAGRRLTVAARAFVLATGGIETPRLLLHWDVGNGHDQVGRYFMEHPHARGGRVVDGAVWSLLRAFGRRHRVAGQDLATMIAPSAALQAEAGILNSSLTITARQPPDATLFWGMRAYDGIKHRLAPTRAARSLWLGTKAAAGWAQRRIDPLRPWALHRLGRRDIALLVRAEQAPDPASRVTLTPARDALGIPRVALDWRLGELDVRSVKVLVETLGAELARLGLGRVEPAAWLDGDRWRSDRLISSHPIGGYHHMGTTRMADDPRHGVTDSRTRVHGHSNLYIAGSSLFPTGGWANPTLTIVALALRTADDIISEFKR